MAALPWAAGMLAQANKAGKTTQAKAPARTAAPVIAPSIPGAQRTGNRIFLDHADVLHKATTDSFMVLSGNVRFSKGAMLMFCDSAHYYPDTESMDAFGNVRMEQGDTLFIYADEMNFRGGAHEIAYLYGYDGNHVRMINRDVQLETDIFTYDLFEERGYYTTQGVLTDPMNRLISLEGEYIPATKEANFYTDVWLHRIDGKDTLDIYTDTLNYNTATHVAEFYSPTTITNARGTIVSTQGVYNTNNNQTELFGRSTVEIERGQGQPKSTLTGDTIFYDRASGYGQAFGNVVLTDSVRQAQLHGQYGFYDQVADSAFFTGRAVGMEYSRGDTLFIHGRYLTSVLRIDTVITPQGDSLPPLVAADSTHIMTAWPRVRFYRTDMQGLCDSMIFVQRDSTLQMHHHPVVWSDDRQIFGNSIILHLNDSTIDSALLPDFAFTAQCIEPGYYNQLTGKRMQAWFEGGELKRVNVTNSVEAIFFPEENDSTINKFVDLQTANLQAWFNDRRLERMKCWPQSTGHTTPLYLAKRSQLFLGKFEWFESLRPTSPDDIFVVSSEMDALMGNSEVENIVPPTSGDIRFAPMLRPQPVILPPAPPEPDTAGQSSSE